MIKELETFVRLVLDDDHGISAAAYNALLDLANVSSEIGDVLHPITDRVESIEDRIYLPTDGRFYLESGR